MSALDIILQRGRVGVIYNIASPTELTMKDLALLLVKMFNLNPEEHIEYVRDRAFNDKRYNIDGGKMKDLNWQPMVSFEEGLRKTSTDSALF